ncbi:MAG TPA: hypothetical protein VL200_15425 [Lacunisphaera sp.]|jgi:hypothetical protein|nr:hypothetical protein [Lacunisphaera sp.]
MKWITLVIFAGLLAAGPFLTSRELGTSEAYNYSLSTADAVSQVRAGQFPVLAGQTEYAFNGRVHPLRTAPYKDYAAIVLDILTRHHLGFWSLQNLTLAASLIAGALAAFWALRRLAGAPPELAAALASFYVLSPGVLAAAYGMDLYMTVMTFPYIPLVIGANVACFSERRSRALPPLAAALALCWLAHPPVAFWLTNATILLQLLALLLRRPTWPETRAYAAAALLFVVLAGFSFASATSISPATEIARAHSVGDLLVEVRRHFSASLLPVSAQADQLGDFQLGYAGWAMAVIALVLAVGRRHRPALALLFTAALLLVATLPVPFLHRWLWEHAPGIFINLTNQWPMQRLYPPIVALVIFAFALVWRNPVIASSLGRDLLRGVLALAVLWTAWQAWRFVGRGFGTQQSAAATQRRLLSPNLNLTVISYALVGTPEDFVHGVMDPAFEFRLLAPYDAHEIASNWTAPQPVSPENRTGILAPVPLTPSVVDLSPTFTLQPGQRYRLNFRFHATPAAGTLGIQGATLSREYPLPVAGGPRGFGMQPGNNTRLTLWTSATQPEDVHLQLLGPGAQGPWRDGPFADYDFERIDPSTLPVQLDSLLPLRCRVRSQEACYLETPRRFIPGYEGAVNGQPVRLQPSPEGSLMLPVPAGDSQVELRYVGTPLVRRTFWLALVGWVAVAAWGTSRALPSRLRAVLDGQLAAIAQRARAAVPSWPPRRWLAGLGAALVVVAAAWGWNQWQDYRRSAGPIRIRFVLPLGQTNRQQPLLVTGRPFAGTFVYAVYVDEEHIRIGYDVWAAGAGQTDPIKVDYFADHVLVVDSGALYPAGHPALRDVAPDQLARLRHHLRVDLDGHTVINRDIDPFPSAVRDVTVGRNRIGGSTCEPRFSGRILAVERLPVPSARD